jgi:hypothetical protein
MDLSTPRCLGGGVAAGKSPADGPLAAMTVDSPTPPIVEPNPVAGLVIPNNPEAGSLVGPLPVVTSPVAKFLDVSLAIAPLDAALPPATALALGQLDDT